MNEKLRKNWDYIVSECIGMRSRSINVGGHLRRAAIIAAAEELDRKCGGLTYGQCERTNDYLCKCPEFCGKSPKEEQPHLQGWECPRCHKIHSPYVSGCTCEPFTITSTNPTIKEEME